MMTILLQVNNTRGLVGRCDAKCYEAEHDDCSCVCGGRNHGKGLEAAKQNIRDMAETMVKEFAEKCELTDYEILVNWNVVNQLRLPLMTRLESARKDN